MNTDLVIRGTDISDAWAQTVVAVAGEPDHRACHVVTRILDPTTENPDMRALADGALEDRGLASVETVANTLFPSALARQTTDPTLLGERYMALLPTLKDLSHENSRGTYFERLVNYETTDGPVNQIAELTRRLSVELATDGPVTARYEVALEQPTAALPVHQAHDNVRIGFPCLSLLSFQLDHGQLHVVAHYRSHYLLQRAYGNYLAVSRLLCYVCGQAGLAPGQVTIVAGYAQVDHFRAATVDTVRQYTSGEGLWA